MVTNNDSLGMLILPGFSTTGKLDPNQSIYITLLLAEMS